MFTSSSKIVQGSTYGYETSWDLAGTALVGAVEVQYMNYSGSRSAVYQSSSQARFEVDWQWNDSNIYCEGPGSMSVGSPGNGAPSTSVSVGHNTPWGGLMSGFANTNSTVTSQGWMHHRITVAGSIGQNTSGWSLPSASWSHCAAAGGSYTENMSPGRPQIGTSPSTYTLNYNGSGLSGFNGSVADSGSSDLSSVTSNAVSRINSNSESPMDFTATNESGNSRLKLMTASNGNAPGVWTMGISNAGNISFSDSSESTPGVADTVVTYNAGDGTSDQVYTFTANKTADEAGALLATEFGIEYDSDTNKLKIVKDEEGTTPTLTVTGDSTLSFSYA